MSRILLLDIETSPLLVYTWGLFEQDAIKKVKQYTILSFSYQWLDENKTQVLACDCRSEKSLLKKLHALLDAADIVIAQNGDAFDIKKINMRLIKYRFKPPSPYATIDTKKEAQKVAAFDSFSLENMSKDLDEGEKIKHRGFEMWEGCMAGKQADWRDMKRYNKRDVDQLRKIYLRLRPWMKRHPRTSEDSICQHCGSGKAQRRGFLLRTTGRKYQRLQCECGAWRVGERIR